LVEDFWARSANDLTKEATSMDQDFIDQGLFHSTVRVSKRMSLHCEFLCKLAGVIVESLEKNYPHLRPSVCQTELINIIEAEYEKLSPMTAAWLHESLPSDAMALASFKQNVTRETEQAKSNIVNACALWAKRWKAGKREKRNSLLKGLAKVGVPAVLVILGWFVQDRIRGGHASHEPKPERVLRDASVDPNTHKTDLFIRTKARVDERADYLIREKIDKWLFMKPGSSERVVLPNGRDYTYAGSEYNDTVAQVFWKSIDPFLEEAVQKVLDEVGKECQSHSIDSRAPLKEAGWLLESMVRQVYRKMADVDQKLRGKGYPQSVPKVDKVLEVERMIEKVRQYLKAATALYSGPPS
jgi:hypothetical protein